MSNLAFEIDNVISTVNNNSSGHVNTGNPVFTSTPAATQTVTAATATVLFATSVNANVEYFTYAAGTITLVQGGTYLCNYSVNFTNAGTDHNATTNLTLAAATLAGSTARVDDSVATALNQYNLSNSVVFSATAGQALLLQFTNTAGDGVIQTNSSINLVKLA